MATQDRLNGALSSLAIKAPCKAGTTGDITLSGLQAVDGVNLSAEDRILVKDQTTGSENGIYIVDTGDWERAPDFDGNLDVTQGTLILINQGTTNAGTSWRLDNTGTISIGSTSLSFSVIAGFSDIVAIANGGTGSTTAAAARTSLSVDYTLGFINVKDPTYGAVGDGVTDDTQAIQNAINAGPTNCLIFFPPGTYLVSSTLQVTRNQVNLIGSGRYATQILFSPTAADICLDILGITTIFRGSVRDMAFYSNDSTNTKTAIRITDASNYLFENIVIAGGVSVSGVSYWSGSSSIGIQIRGRELGFFRNLEIIADRPIVISDNPNSTIDIDHHNFFDLYLIANGNPCVEIDSGVNLTSVSFDGKQAWVRGTYGLYWADTATTQSSLGLSIRNLRSEQGTSSSAYSVYISHNHALYLLNIESSRLDPSRNGIFLANIRNATFNEVMYEDTTKIALTADSTVYPIALVNCFWQTGSTATTTGLNQVFAVDTAASSPLPATAVYDTSTTYIANSDGTTGGTGSAGAGSQYVELVIGGTTYKVLHDGTV